MSWGRRDKSNAFLKCISTKWNTQPWPVFEFGLPISFPMTITIALGASMYAFTQPLHMSRMWHEVNFLKKSLTRLNSELSFSLIDCHTKAKELSLPYYLPTAGRKIVGFITFQRVLAQYEMLTTLSKIWTRVTKSIFLCQYPLNYLSSQLGL